MTLDRVLLGMFLVTLEVTARAVPVVPVPVAVAAEETAMQGLAARGAVGTWACVGEEGIEDQVGLPWVGAVAEDPGIRQVSKDAAVVDAAAGVVVVARQECLLEGPLTISSPGDGIEGIDVREPR